MEQVYIIFALCLRKDGATKKEIFIAMDYFNIQFKESDWQRLMRMNKYECDLFLRGCRWFSWDYCMKRYVQQTLENEDNFMGFSMYLPSFFVENRNKFRSFFSVSDYDFC